jgi:Regulator of ribonuclease activity B
MRLIKKLMMAIGIVSAIDSASQAQNESQDSWFSFVRNSEGVTWVTTINETLLANIETSEVSCFALIYQFRPDQLVNSAMPKPELSEFYYGLEDKIEASDFSPKAIRAASIVGGGIRKTSYCSFDKKWPTAIEELLKSFDQIPVQLVLSSAVELVRLKPTNTERQLQGDSDILQNLATQGDDGVVPREIRHWIYGAPVEKRLALTSRLESIGYRIEENSDGKIVFSVISALSIKSANNVTIQLNEICNEFGCEYDGWETAVVKK